MISIVVAMDLESGIGKDGGMPWHLSTDLRRFKQITMGHPVIMGRKTFDAIGKPLPGRKNIIISRNPQFEAPGCFVVESLDKALEVASKDQDDLICVIGGGQIFTQVLPLTNQLHLTQIHTIANCDVFFPELRWSEWHVLHQEFVPAGKKDQFSSTYYVLER